MRSFVIIAVIITALLIAAPIYAAPIDDLKGTHDAIYSTAQLHPVGGSIGISYSLLDPDFKAYSYVIRVYSQFHLDIVLEKRIEDPAGAIALDTAGLPQGTYYANLQREIPEPAGIYVGPITKNLDMVRLDIGKASSKANLYLSCLQAWTDLTTGASWAIMKGAA